ncbi:MAG TPA: hypothetical protein VGP13_00600 [Candidatus Paceibacterota bacterium]|jgi:endonuclease/exonuclease/phosphatase family metal-dependent hydrolase|nr:hypothetical protein [Candidatus Paceibacterota bacterium]
MKLLSLNCQRGYQPGLEAFLHRTLEGGRYDFLLLQEFAKDVPSYVQGVGDYLLLQENNTDVDELSQTIILYRKTYRLLGCSFIPFAKMRKDPVMGYKHATFGSLMARFETDSGPMVVGSMHLHSGIDRKVRAAQVAKIKQQALALRKDGDQTIFGGDCNFGLPGEHKEAERMMAPEFACVTQKIGPTLDGRYSENVPHLPNRIARLLGFFGIPTPLWTDQVFVDAQTAASKKITCRVLPGRVSDHSPVEMVI